MTAGLATIARRIETRTEAFQNDTHGTIAIVFALGLVVILGFVGSVIDFANAFRMRQELWAAADSASLSVVSSGTDAYNVAVAQVGDGEVKEAERLALSSFYASIYEQHPELGIPSATAKVEKVGGTVTATIDFSVNVPAHFLGLLGHMTVPVSGHATSVNGTAAFVNFYLVLDNSPSMGIGATTRDQDDLIAATANSPIPGAAGCAFACHESDHPGIDNYAIAHAAGVKTRIDVLREATQKLMDTAQATASQPGQFGVSIDTFNLSTHPITPLTTDLTAAKAAADAIDLMVVPSQGWNNDRDTDFEVALNDITRKVPASGSGVDAAHPQNVVFFVTDGVADQDATQAQHIVAGANSFDGRGRVMQAINADLCKKLKDKGVKVAVIYPTYNPIPSNWYYMNHIDGWRDEISPHAKACASPGYFFEVAPNQGIDAAMQELFLKAVNEAKISS